MSPTLLGEKAAAHDEGAWARHAIELIQNDQRRSADTHLLRFDAPALDGIDIYLKDESTHPTGSLKHRLARSLFLYGICNGRIGPGTTLVEASSGSTGSVSRSSTRATRRSSRTTGCRPWRRRGTDRSGSAP